MVKWAGMEHINVLLVEDSSWALEIASLPAGVGHGAGLLRHSHTTGVQTNQSGRAHLS